MKLVKPSFEILEQDTVGLMQHIERCARTCYKSEDRITEESSPKFIDMLIKRGHTAMLEHGTVYLVVLDSLPGGFGGPAPEEEANILEFYYKNKYSDVVEQYIGMGAYQYHITTNYRVLLQNDRLKDLEYQCEPTEHHVKRVTVKFICDRGVSHEFVRHRVFSFAQESTRYCNYTKDKFGNECTFIIPNWFDKYIEEDYSNHHTLDWQPGLDIACAETNWLYAMLFAEKVYFSSLENGMIAQQARAVLPNSLKTELVMTGTIKQWKDFFKLRCAKDAHPQARELAIPLHEEFIKRGWLQEVLLVN